MRGKILLLFPILFTGYLSFGQNDKNNQNQMKDTIQAVSSKDTLKSEEPKRDVPWYVERFRLSAGFYTQLNNTNVSVDNASGTRGTDINFENDLGFNDKSQSFIAEFEWRASSRSRFDLTYFETKRHSSYRLVKDIEFDGETYNINSEVYAYLNSSIIRFSYGYAILSKPKYEVGLLIGTHTNTIKAGIGAVGENANLEKNKDYKVTAPLLDVGIWGGYAISNRFAVRGEFNYFQLSIGNIEGKVLGYNFNVVYQVLKSFELTAGFSGLNFKVDESGDNVNSDIRWDNNGMFFMASYTFGNKNWH